MIHQLLMFDGGKLIFYKNLRTTCSTQYLKKFILPYILKQNVLLVVRVLEQILSDRFFLRSVQILSLLSSVKLK